jgi:hypothetical protein
MTISSHNMVNRSAVMNIRLTIKNIKALLTCVGPRQPLKKIRIVGGGVQTGSTRQVDHFWPMVLAQGDCEDG